MNDVIVLSRFRAALGTKSGSSRKRELLQQKEPTQAVQALHPMELYALSADLGIADAIELVLLASDEQIVALFDIAAGASDHPDFVAFNRWLEAAQSTSNEASLRLFSTWDESLQTLYIARHLRIYQVHDQSDDEALRDPSQQANESSSNAERYTTPDGTFILEAKSARDADESAAPAPSSEDSAVALRLVAELYADNWQRADTILRDAKHTLMAELEAEWARAHEGRLEELGFPSQEEAIRLFAPAKAGPMAVRRPTHEQKRPLPARYAEGFSGDDFLLAVFGKITDATLLSEIEGELITLTNTTLVAHRGWPRDLDSLRLAATDVRSALRLGLEILAGNDLDKAVALVHAHPLKEIMKQGYSWVHKLKAWTQKAKRGGLLSIAWARPTSQSGAPVSLLPAYEEAFLSALVAPVPRYVEAPFAQPRAFASRRELAVAQSRLEEIANDFAAAKWLYPDPGQQEALNEAIEKGGVTLDRIVRTALVKSVVGRANEIFATPLDLVQAKRAPDPQFLRQCPEALRAHLEAKWQELRAELEKAEAPAEPRFLNLLTRANESFHGTLHR